MRSPRSCEVQCWKEQCDGLQKTCAPQLHCQLTLDGAIPFSGSQLVLKDWFSNWLQWHVGILWSRLLSFITLFSLLGF